MTDVFNNETKVETPVTAPADPVVDKRLKDKDDYIARLEAQTADLRQEVEKFSTAAQQLEELRNEVKSLKENKTAIQPRENTTPVLTEVDIKTLVQKTITEAETSKSTAQNVKDANDALVESFGGDLSKAGEAVVNKAKELNVSVEFLREVAAKSPTAFLDVMGQKTEKKSDSSFVQGTVNTGSLEKTNHVAKEGTKAWFDNVRKTDPKTYWTPGFQQKLWDAAKKGSYFPS